MVLQHSSVRKSLHWHVITIILFNAKVGILLCCNTIIHLLGEGGGGEGEGGDSYYTVLPYCMI